jgi:hypothetical protein
VGSQGSSPSFAVVSWEVQPDAVPSATQEPWRACSFVAARAGAPILRTSSTAVACAVVRWARPCLAWIVLATNFSTVSIAGIGGNTKLRTYWGANRCCCGEDWFDCSCSSLTFDWLDRSVNCGGIP